MQYRKTIKWWLWIGVGMVLVQIVLGGVTRLTGSGLSITKWEIVTGTIPPLSADAWESEFDLYKETPQYAKINEGMSLSDFKFIYFWEFFHRFWGRLIGLVFLIPFLIFLFLRQLDPLLIKRVLGAVLFGGVVGLFGWIMVASGLINRPWVNAYKLMLHLGLAVLLFGYMVFVSTEYQMRKMDVARWKINVPMRTLKFLTMFIFVQILLGAIMSGMKAGLFFPTWPMMNGEWIPDILFHSDNWSIEAFKEYDRNTFVPGLIQFLHRGLAYAIFVLFLLVAWRYREDKTIWWAFGLLCLQVVLGIWTLINCVGSIPLTLGVLHQIVGIGIFGYMVILLTRKSHI
jgi:cytochrome c oxidase assembly protein subunit 15